MLLRSHIRSYAFSTLCSLFAIGSSAANASYILADEGKTESVYHYVIDNTKSTAVEDGLVFVDPEQKPQTYSLSGQFDATLVHSWWSFVNPEIDDRYFVEEIRLRFTNVALTGTPISFDLLDVGGDGASTASLSSGYCGPTFPDTSMSCWIWGGAPWQKASLQGRVISLLGESAPESGQGGYQFAITANLVPEPSTLSLVCLACVGFLFRRGNKGRRVTLAL